MVLDEMFYDEAVYEKHAVSNKFGKYANTESKTIKCRKVKNKSTYVIQEDTYSTALERVYHIPKDIDIQEKDKLDGHIVKAVLPCRDLFGKLFYWKVWVL